MVYLQIEFFLRRFLKMQFFIKMHFQVLATRWHTARFQLQD